MNILYIMEEKLSEIKINIIIPLSEKYWKAAYQHPEKDKSGAELVIYLYRKKKKKVKKNS